MSFKEKPWYPVVYMFVVTAFFSSILIGLSRFTQNRVEVNQQVAVERAVLKALPLDLPDKPSSLEVHKIFVDQIAPPSEASGGAYVLNKDGKVAGYGLPISGRGFWDEIKGIIGIAPNGKTITGIAFYEQNETPGLGAEITQPKFRSQFPGKQIARTGPPMSILAVGARLGPSDVHAVTGATQTSTRLQKIINQALVPWRSRRDNAAQ